MIDQHSMDDLKDYINDMMKELDLSTLGKAMLPTQARTGENHNHTVDSGAELSKFVRT